MRTDETIAKRFPGRGEIPSNEVLVDPEAELAPNTDHPGAEEE